MAYSISLLIERIDKFVSRASKCANGSAAIEAEF